MLETSSTPKQIEVQNFTFHKLRSGNRYLGVKIDLLAENNFGGLELYEWSKHWSFLKMLKVTISTMWASSRSGDQKQHVQKWQEKKLAWWVMMPKYWIPKTWGVKKMTHLSAGMNQTEDVFIHKVSLPLTNSSHQQMCRAPKGYASSNHPFLGAKTLVLGTVMLKP